MRRSGTWDVRRESIVMVKRVATEEKKQPLYEPNFVWIASPRGLQNFCVAIGLVVSS